MEQSNNAGSPMQGDGLQKDLLTLQLEINKLRTKIYNILWNKIPSPVKPGGLLILGEPLLAKQGIDHVMVILDTNLDPNTLLTDLSQEQVYDLILIIMQSVGNALVFNPDWGVTTFDKFDAVYDAIFICVFLTLCRCVKGMTFKGINERYTQKMLQSPMGMNGIYGGMGGYGGY
jgi:hypothetical protein